MKEALHIPEGIKESFAQSSSRNWHILIGVALATLALIGVGVLFFYLTFTPNVPLVEAPAITEDTTQTPKGPTSEEREAMLRMMHPASSTGASPEERALRIDIQRTGTPPTTAEREAMLKSMQ